MVQARDDDVFEISMDIVMTAHSGRERNGEKPNRFPWS